MWLYRIASLLAAAIPAILLLSVPRRGLLLALVWLIAVAVWLRLSLPSMASSAFRSGELSKAERRYRWLTASWQASRRDAAWLSLCACHVARHDYGVAKNALMEVGQPRLGASEQAAYANCQALLALHEGALDQALTHANRACELRPDVAELAHTRGAVLLALGNLDQAVTIIDSLGAATEHPRFEAERCADLALAWHRSGHRDYALDYVGRARRFWQDVRISDEIR
jgi:tetratricopeptide (TPR) repeat protein